MDHTEEVAALIIAIARRGMCYTTDRRRSFRTGQVSMADGSELSISDLYCCRCVGLSFLAFGGARHWDPLKDLDTIS